MASFWSMLTLNLLILKNLVNKLPSLLTVSDFLFSAAIVIIKLHPVRIK